MTSTRAFVQANLVVVTSITIGLVVVGVAAYRLFLHPLCKFPGPRIAALTGLWRTYRYMNGAWHDDILELHRTYGKVVRIAPNELSIVDEKASKLLYGHGHSAPKTNWYATWDVPNAGPGLFATRDKNVHAFLRKRLAGAYSMSSILKYEAYIQACLGLCLERVGEKSDAGEAVDMSSWTNAFAFDVVGELAYGQPLGHLRTGTDVMALRENIYLGFQMMSTTGHLPLQSRLLNNQIVATVRKLLGVPDVFSGFRSWSERRVFERLADSEKKLNHREDMLAHFCRMKAADGGPATPGEVLLEAMNIIGAGADTTSIGIRSCLYYVARSQGTYEKLQAEVDQFYADNKLHEPITYLQTQQLPYLMAVVREATRLFPSINFQLLRHAPLGFAVDGRDIPFGTPVGVSPLAQNRDKGIWGEDADEFKPERWLGDPEQRRRLDVCDMTFGGSGPRMCIGRNIALVELHKFLAQFVRNFDFVIANEQSPWEVSSYWFAYQRNFNLRLTRRHL